MESGNFAEAQLRALIDVAAVAAGAHRLEDVLELAAERSLKAVGGSSLAISRLDAEAGVIRTLVNVGELGPGEERFPKDETYAVDDFPSMRRAMREGGSSLGTIDDPDTDPALRELLTRLGKESSLAVPIMLGGEPWGELEVMTAPGHPRLAPGDEMFLRAIADQLVGAIHRAELFAQVEALAYTDSLTGLASRRAVEMALEEACDAASAPGSPALVLCDIDDLKQVNDSGGHEAGDQVLRRAADALVGAAEPHEDAVVGRFGGDEFCILLPTGTAAGGQGPRAGGRATPRLRGRRADVVRRCRADRGGNPARGAPARGGRGAVPGEERRRRGGRSGGRRGRRGRRIDSRPRPRVPRRRSRRPAGAGAPRNDRQHERRRPPRSGSHASALDSSARSDSQRWPRPG